MSSQEHNMAVLGQIVKHISKHSKFISGGRRYPGMPWRFKRAIHVVDSTTIRLIAKCVDWAKHTKQKAAAKMHLDLDLRSFLPNFAIVNRAKDSDPKMAWKFCDPIRAGESRSSSRESNRRFSCSKSPSWRLFSFFYGITVG